MQTIEIPDNFPVIEVIKMAHSVGMKARLADAKSQKWVFEPSNVVGFPKQAKAEGEK